MIIFPFQYNNKNRQYISILGILLIVFFDLLLSRSLRQFTLFGIKISVNIYFDGNIILNYTIKSHYFLLHSFILVMEITLIYYK